METFTAMKQINVLSCSKVQDNEYGLPRWKITCLELFDSFKDKDKSFNDASFKSRTYISDYELSRGWNVVFIEIDEDAHEVDGKIVVTQDVVFTEIEDWGPKFKELMLSENNSKDYKSLLKKREEKKVFRETLSSTNFKFERSPLEFDYLSCVGDLHNFNINKKTHKRKLIRIFRDELGLELTHDKSSMVFQSKEMGVRTCFSNFRGNNQEYGYAPNLKIEFTGQFFIRENADLAVRKLLIRLMREFGAIFHPTRVDIRQDIYDAYHPFDYFPDFREADKLHWSLRSDPNISTFYDSFEDKETGFSIRTSRYNITSYNRKLNLEKKFEKGKISKSYYDHYMNLYGDRDVQRLELRLLQKDSCSVFYKMFMAEEFYDKDKVLTYTMANFARNHVLRDIGNESRHSRYKENEVFAELFFLDEKEDFKIFKRKIEEKANISFSDMMFSLPEDRLNKNMKNYGKNFCLKNGSEDIEEALSALSGISSLSYLMGSIEEHRNIHDDRVSRIKKTLSFFEINEEDLLATSLAINRGENIAMSYG